MAEIDLSELAQFNGTETWYRDRLSGILYTEGVQYISDKGAHWFISDTLINISMLPELSNQDFLHIQVKKTEETKAVYTIDDGNNNILYKQEIPFTDLNVEKLRLFFSNNVLMLPSEY